MKDVYRKLLVLVAIVLSVGTIFPLIEGAASAPGALIQLATSSPYQNSGWVYPRNGWGNSWVRPVLQRGMYFGRPRWHR